jgi:hypothetical protein
MPVKVINRKADINAILRRWMFTNFNLLVFETLWPTQIQKLSPTHFDVST